MALSSAPSFSQQKLRDIKKSRTEVKAARLAPDLEAMLALENRVFASDRMSRRSVRHFLSSPNAAVLVAETARCIDVDRHLRAPSLLGRV